MGELDRERSTTVAVGMTESVGEWVVRWSERSDLAATIG